MLRPAHSPRAREIAMRLSSNRVQQLEQYAATMRHAPTSSEAKLFRGTARGEARGHVSQAGAARGRFIADFYAPAVKLVVEVDGGYHAERERADGRRIGRWRSSGCTCFRLPAQLVTSDPGRRRRAGAGRDRASRGRVRRGRGLTPAAVLHLSVFNPGGSPSPRRAMTPASYGPRSSSPTYGPFTTLFL